MIVETESLRVLDARLENRAELLSEAARAMPGLSVCRRELLRGDVLEYLDEVDSHLRMDERSLYPMIAERLGDPFAAAPMQFANRAIRWWTAELGRADLADADELQRILYGLHALIRVHLSREEQLYAGVLESPTRPAGS